MKRRSPVSTEPPTRSAFQEALRFLARRGRSRAEVADHLARQGHASQEIEDAQQRLIEEKLLDDRALAEHYIAARSERLGHGPLRLFRELEQRGIAFADMQIAWQRLLGTGEIDPEAVLNRRVCALIRREGGSADSGSYRRIYSRLLRAGFEPASIHRALKTHKDHDAIR